MARFQVLTVTGWRIKPNQRNGWTHIGAGVSATVYDAAYDRDIATYRSDDVGVNGAASRRKANTIRKAHEHADRLEAEYGG